MPKFAKLLLLTSLFLMACSSVKVSQDYDPSKSLDNLKTYAWQSATQPPTGDIRVDSPLLDARIRAALERNLAALGYVKISDGQPDFLVAYRYMIQRKIESDEPRVGFGFGLGNAGSFGGIGIGTGSRVSEVDQGLLIVDFLEAPGGALLWRGNGSRRVEQHADPEKTTEQINEMVDKIMAQIASPS